jgi:2-iminobutanoate/2-iminopropanoate deaminase
MAHPSRGTCILLAPCANYNNPAMKIAIALALAALPLAAQTQFLNPGGLSKPPGYTHVVVARPGKLVFIAGQVANDKTGKVVSGDFRAQATQVFENLKTALTAAGASFDDVVKINYYVRNYTPELRPALREVRDSYVNKEHPPASTLVGVVALANDDYLLEVEAVAVIPEKRGGKR